MANNKFEQEITIFGSEQKEIGSIKFRLKYDSIINPSDDIAKAIVEIYKNT